MAMYQPSSLSPENIGISGSIDNIFTWTVNGDSQTDYQIYIYNNTNNSSVYDSGKILSATPTHTVPASSFSNNLELKWKVKVFHNANYAESDWVLFKSHTTPSVVLSATPTDQQNYTFQSIYYQSEGVSIKKFKYLLYDASDVVLLDSGWQYPGTSATPTTLEYAVTGMISGTTYKIECQAYNIYDMYATTDKTAFSVTYEFPDDTPALVVTGQNDTGGIKLDWAELKQILGVVNGSYSYVDGLTETFDTYDDFLPGTRSNIEITLEGSIQIGDGSWSDFSDMTWEEFSGG